MLSNKAVAAVFPGRYGEEAVLQLKAWRSTIWDRAETAHNLVEGNNGTAGTLSGPHVKFSPFVPFVDCPPGTSVQRFGGQGEHMDGGKLLCADMAMHVTGLPPDCVILSLGSQGDYSFEMAMLNNTPCVVHTLDCTYDGKAQHERHRWGGGACAARGAQWEGAQWGGVQHEGHSGEGHSGWMRRCTVLAVLLKSV